MAGLANLKSTFSDLVDNGTTQGVNYIDNIHANGFTVNIDGTDFLGIEGSTYNNPSEFGYNNDVVNTILDVEGFGFVPLLQAGDDSLFRGVTDTTYTNPGKSIGVFYVDDYENGPTPDGINFTKNRQEKDPSEYAGVDETSFNHPDPDEQIIIEDDHWQDIFGHKFTPNRKHLDPTEFKGASGTNYSNPGELVGLHYYEVYDDAGLGVDAIEDIHATGFTKLRKHKDPSEFMMIDGDLINPANDDVNSGTLFRQFGNSVFLFGGEQKNKYLSNPGNTYNEKNVIDPDEVSLIQQGGTRSNLINGSDVTAITLEDIYNDHINDLIDFKNVKGKTDGRLDMRHGNGKISSQGFLPLAFDRGEEPYVIRGIGDSKNVIDQSLDDIERVGKYLFDSQDGIKFIAAQNVVGYLANAWHRNIKHGTDERYGFFGASVGKQQFQYTYNPLSAFSSTTPYIKVRMSRSFLFDEDKYTESSDPIFGLPDFTPNKNSEVEGITKQKLTADGDKHTTLGGSILYNVNQSIDGTTVNNQGIPGDFHTLAPIDEEEQVIINKRGNKDSLATIEEGYPFYFKDMRNDKILMFRGYIKDLSENIAPTYSSENYIGRSEPVVSYQSTTRTLNFSLDLYANNPDEFESIYQKLDYLTGLCYPEYFNDSSTEGYTLTRPKPPLCRMRLADLYGGGKKAQNDNAALKHGLLGFLNTLSYTYNEEGTWNYFDEGTRAPKYITATLGFTVLHDTTPDINTRFYGVNYDKIGV